MAAVACPGCGFRANLPAGAEGKAVRCPRCQTRFQVPATAPGPTARTGAPESVGPTGPLDRALAPVAPPLPLPTVPEGRTGAVLPTVAEGPVPRVRGPRSPLAPTLPAAEAPPPALAEWQVGDVVLDLYEVTGVLGQGGMGRVYRVHHRGWGVDLAVKAPLPSVLDAVGGADNFEREAETWVNLGLHPHIAACYYVRRVDGIPRVFAELVDGGSLHDWIQKRRLLRLDQVLDIAIQFAWGLHYAHEQGLVHQDVKPANVLVTPDGIAKVTDFGLARARPVGEGGGVAVSGQTMMVAGSGAGTLAYMAPEQATGEPLTRRTDLWAWALSVLEMFRGERTWEYGVAAPEVLAEFLAQGGKSLGLPAMPSAVAELLQRCFRKNPDQRPRSLWDAAAALYAAYEAATSSPYYREEPQAGRDTADSLNNRAVSLLDLGREGEAEALWRRALSGQAHHVEATYNEALHDWSRGRASDEEMLNRMEEALKTHESAPRAHHLLGKLLLSAGEYARAVRSLKEEFRFGPGSPELERDLGLALCAEARESPEASLWSRAADCLESAMTGGQEPADIAGYALSLRRQGREEEARRFYAEAAGRRRDLPASLDQAVSLHLPGYEALRSLKGLGRSATSLVLTRDGRFVLAGDGLAVRQWDVETGTAVRTLQAAEGGVRSLAVTPDGQALLWAGENVPPQLWAIDSGRPGRVFQRHPGFLVALAITPDGARVVSGGSDRTVRLWDVASGRCLQTLEGHTEAVVGVAVSADGVRAVSGSLDGTVRVWDLAAGAPLLKLEEHKGRVSAVALLGSEGLAVSGGEDRVLRLWELPTGKLVESLAGHTRDVTSLALSADGAFVVSGSLDRTVRAWDLERRRLHFLARLEAPVQAVALGPGGIIWAANGTTVTALRLPDRPRVAMHAVSRPVSAAEAVSRDTAFLGRVEEAQQSFQKGNVKQALKLARDARNIPGYERSEAGLALWDELCAVLPRKGLRSAWEVAALEGHSDPVLSVAVSPDGGRALSGGMDATVRLWDLGRREMLSELNEHQATVAAVAFCPDGRRAVSGSWDRTARVWDLVSGRCLHRLEGHADYVSGVAVSPDGTQVLTASWDQTLRLWDLASGSCLGTFEGHESNVSAVAFGPDGRFAVSGGWEGAVRAWDVETRACVCLLEGHEKNVSALCLSPSGRQVGSGGLDGSVRVWDLKTRRALRTLTGHTNEVTAVAFTPDGRYVVSAGRDKTVKVWEVSSGKCERTLDLTAAALELGLTPVGNELLTAQADRTVRIWHLDWEPEEPDAPALPPWDEKARPYLETFVSLRLKPQTLRTTAPAFTDKDVDVLLHDLRHRGFGGLRRESLKGKLRDLTVQGQAPPSFWDEVRRAAPRPARTSAEPPLWRRLPLMKMALGAVAVALVIVGVRSWFKPPAQPVIMEHWVKVVQDQQRLIDVKSFTGACDEGGLDHYLQQAWQREVSADVLACVVRYANEGTADAYLDGVTLTDPDALNLHRRLRNAISLLVALGEPAVDPLCRRLGDPREEVRRVAARALVAMGSAASSTCLVKAFTDPGPAVRGSAAYILDRMLMGGQMSADTGWTVLTALLQDPEPSVRALALGALPLYATGVAEPAAQRALQDPDPDVRAAADKALVSIKTARKLRQLSGRE